ncbi:uncharacterized protein BDV17DRAFT_116428 [Aspergillus undulatus]|uniref:uncharacterized protein n=1 Tax=Aspergillus undulatus TaxID=1810928 RepID=UPI003CCE2785
MLIAYCQWEACYDLENMMLQQPDLLLGSSSSVVPQGKIHKRGKVVHGPPKTLGLFKAFKCGRRAPFSIIFRDKESPWDTFQPFFECRLAGRVITAVQKSYPYRIKAIREYSENAGEILRLFNTVHHRNVLSANECYRNKGQLFVLVEDCPLTLEHLVSLSPDQDSLGAIMFQILNGISYLMTAGFEHTRLSCSNILLTSNGTVKIAGLEHCSRLVSNKAHTAMIKAVASITMRLMQSYEMDDGIIGVDDIERWPIDSEAFRFLKATSSVKSINTLLEVSRLLKCSGHYSPRHSIRSSQNSTH